MAYPRHNATRDVLIVYIPHVSVPSLGAFPGKIELSRDEVKYAQQVENHTRAIATGLSEITRL